MPQFTNYPDIQQLWLPSTENEPDENKAWVTMDVSPQKASDMLGFSTSMTEAEMGFSMISARLKDWNYEDAQGEKVPINMNTIGLLSTKDFQFLQNSIKSESVALGAEEKKDLPPTSPVSVPVTVQE